VGAETNKISKKVVKNNMGRYGKKETTIIAADV
jgi:hypothetical protein